MMWLYVLASGLLSALAGSLIGWLITRRMRRADWEKQRPGQRLPTTLYLSTAPDRRRSVLLDLCWKVQPWSFIMARQFTRSIKAIAGTAFVMAVFTGQQETVQTVGGGMAWRCHYSANGQQIVLLYPSTTTCPPIVEVQ